MDRDDVISSIIGYGAGIILTSFFIVFIAVSVSSITIGVMLDIPIMDVLKTILSHFKDMIF